MSFSDALENEVLDVYFGRASPTLNTTTLYIGLSTTTPTDAGGNFTEPSGGAAYARVAYTNNGTNWPSASGGTKQNANNIQFPAATGSWGTITYFGIFTASSGGTPIATGQLSSSKTPAVGDTLIFPTNGITITAD